MNDDYGFINGFNNYIFKEIFGKNKERFRMLIKLLIKEDFPDSELELISTSRKEMMESKGIDADILASFNNVKEDTKIMVDVEAQNYFMSEMGLIRRQAHYASLLFSGMYESGDNTYYSKDRKLIEIYLITEKLNNGIGITKTTLHTGETGKDYDVFCFYNVYVEEIIKKLEKTKNDDILLLELLKLLKSDNVDSFKKSKNKMIREVADMVYKLNQSFEDRAKAIMEMKAAEREGLVKFWAREEGIEIGKKDGIEIGQKMSIKALYSNGMSKEDIAKNLSLELSYVEEVLK